MRTKKQDEKHFNENKYYGTYFVCTGCKFSDKDELVSQCDECLKDELHYEMQMNEIWENE